MAIVQIGTVMADFTNRNRVEFPPVRLRKGRGYLFFIETTDPNVVITRGYVNLIARIETNLVVLRSPLLAKYFPQGSKMFFQVPYPDGDWRRRADVVIEGLPREFNRNSAEFSQVELALSYEDDQDFRLDGFIPSA